MILVYFAQSAGAAEEADYISAKKLIMVRLRSWTFRECWVLLNNHYYQARSEPEELSLLKSHLCVK